MTTSTRDVVFIALFAAIIAVLGVFPPITLPVIAVPITAQSLGVMLAGGILGAKRGALAVVLFLVLVAAGLPLLSGGRGGFAIFLTGSGGFLIGWVVAAFVIGAIVEKLWDNLSYIGVCVACAIGGVLVLYLIGIPWIAYTAKIPLLKALTISAAYIPGDIIKIFIASGVIMTVAKSYPIIKSR